MNPALALAAPKAAPLLRLMASANDNEALVALRGLKRVLAARGLDLNDLAAWIEAGACEPAPEPEPPPRPKPQPQPEPQGRQPWPQYWFGIVDGLLRDGADIITDRDREFLANVRAATMRGRSPSHAQRVWIEDIKLRVRGRV